MKTIHKISIVGGLGLVLIAISSYVAKQARLLKDACYTIVGAVIHNISYNNFSFSLLMHISNKSDINFSVSNQRYNIYINSMLVAKIEKPKIINVNAKGKTTVSIDVKFNPQDLLSKGMESIGYLIQDKTKIIIEVKGYLSLKAGVVTVKDYEVDERLTLADLLSGSPKNEKCEI